MKKRCLAATLCLLLSLTACGQNGVQAETPSEPVETPDYEITAPAAYDPDSAEEIVFPAAGSRVTISEAGTYRISGQSQDGQLWVAADKGEEVTLIFDSLDLTSSTAPLVVEQAGLVTVVLADGSENRLADGSNYNLTVDGSTVDGTVFSKADLVLTGSGSLTVNGNSAHGIVSKDTLEITGGSYAITAVKSGINGKDCLKVADAGLTITAGTDGMKSSNDADPDLGYVYIQSGTMTIDAGDDGIHAERALVIEDGDITILNSEEGLEGSTVTIYGGRIDVTARDDAVNGAGAPDSASGNGMMADSTAAVEIHGGYVLLNAGGDGVDSNGSLTMTGGVLLVNGPTNSGNGALDYASDAVITGGVVMAVGSSGMAASFGQNSTQGVIAVSLEPQSGGRTLALCEESGQVLAAFTPSKPYSHLVVSAPGIADGGSYTVCTGTLQGGDENGYAESGTLADAAVLAEITMDGLNYGGMGGMFGGKGGGSRGDMGGGDMGRGFQGGGMTEKPENGEMPEVPGGGNWHDKGEQPELPEMPGDGQIPVPEEPPTKQA